MIHQTQEKIVRIFTTEVIPNVTIKARTEYALMELKSLFLTNPIVGCTHEIETKEENHEID